MRITIIGVGNAGSACAFMTAEVERMFQSLELVTRDPKQAIEGGMLL